MHDDRVLAFPKLSPERACPAVFGCAMFSANRLSIGGLIPRNFGEAVKQFGLFPVSYRHETGTRLADCLQVLGRRCFGSTLMPALLPIILTASHIVLVADAIPKFDVEQTCRRASEFSVSLGRSAGDCKT